MGVTNNTERFVYSNADLRNTNDKTNDYNAKYKTPKVNTSSS